MNNKNLEKLKTTHIGKWKIVGIEECYKNEHHIGGDHYNIRLSRDGHIGAAIQIEREAGEYGYNVCVCYNQYDRFISTTAWPKDRLLNKDNFFASMQGILDAEYDKHN